MVSLNFRLIIENFLAPKNNRTLGYFIGFYHKFLCMTSTVGVTKNVLKLL